MRLPIALSALIFCASCGDAPLDRLRSAEARRVAAEARELPELPEWCRREHATAVAAADPLNLALAWLAADRRAYRDQVRACADWFDSLRAGWVLQ